MLVFLGLLLVIISRYWFKLNIGKILLLMLIKHSKTRTELKSASCILFAGNLNYTKVFTKEGAVAQWCNPLTLRPEESGRVDSIPGRTPPLERHDMGLRIQSALSYFCNFSVWR